MRSHEKGGEIPARALAHINGEQLAVISEICLVFCGHMEAHGGTKTGWRTCVQV